MMEPKRSFEAVSADGRRFSVIEFATYRWERNARGERCRVENAWSQLVTADGLEVAPTEDPAAFRVKALQLTVLVLDEADTLRDLDLLRAPFG